MAEECDKDIAKAVEYAKKPDRDFADSGTFYGDKRSQATTEFTDMGMIRDVMIEQQGDCLELPEYWVKRL